MDVTDMDIECAGFTFVSSFDSGNVAKVELVSKKQGTNTNTGKISPTEDVPDFEFNIWTKPDCAGTEYENSNRTWFYFGIKGGAPFALVKLNIMNLNKQSKMYSQGMAPVYRIVPGRSHWDRIKDKPSYAVEENVFILTFKYRTLENLRATTYFAFTYPYSYVDLQNMLNGIDMRFRMLEEEPRGTTAGLDDIYYHRECVCYSLEGRRVELLTVSSFHNMISEREIRLQNLFPDDTTPRAFRFLNKKVIFISARVHPGETPSSFVFNGFLNLLLNRDDPVAILLRKMYVFKLIPVLNPDGVSRGHYRTDTRGVNLNRVYLNPSFLLHPSVFAARSLIRYYHHGREMEDNICETSLYATDNPINGNLNLAECFNPVEVSTGSPSPEQLHLSPYDNDNSQFQADLNKVSNIESQVSYLSLEEKKTEAEIIPSKKNENYIDGNRLISNSSPKTLNQGTNDIFASIHETLLKRVINICNVDTQNLNSATISVIAEGLPDKALIIEGVPKVKTPQPVFEITPYESDCDIPKSAVSPGVKPHSSVEYSPNDIQSPALTTQSDKFNFSELNQVNLNCKNIFPDSNSGNVSAVSYGESLTEPEDSGLFLYVDLHGHASKKGIFMYGNHFENIEDSIECMLLPKIMSLNSANFHFTACNFTERNMYLRDRRDGMSREGSGRVAVLKATGLVRSYTLECNYNTGRLVNILPPCMRDTTKPSPVHMVPPKYTPQVFEEVGRALGVSILDLTGSNPWSRIPNSEFRTLTGIRDWLKSHCVPEQLYLSKVLRNQKQMRRQPCNTQVVCVAGAPVRTARTVRPSSSGSGCKTRVTTNKHDPSFSRNRRLAPLMSKSSEPKLNRAKVAGNSSLGVLCPTDIGPDEEAAENIVEDSERKENMSSFQVISPPQSPSNIRLGKHYPGPKENIALGPSQRCASTSKKHKVIQATASGVVKQVLAVRSKCTGVGPLVGSSKTKVNPGIRMQRIPSLGNVGALKKGNQSVPAACGRLTKFRRGSITKSSRESCLGLCACPNFSDFDVPQLQKKGLKPGSMLIARASTSNEKVKCNKDDQKSINEQVIIKQGSKRLKISSVKSEQVAVNASVSSAFQRKNDIVGVGKLKLKDICLLNLGGKDKKLLAKYSSLAEPESVESQVLSEEDLVISWDSNRQSGFLSLGTTRQNSLSMKSKLTQRKSVMQNAIPKTPTPIIRASRSDHQGTSNVVKTKYSTKSEKQGKGKVQHLSPIKTLKKSPSFGKKTNSELGKKRTKVSLRNLASSVGKLRASVSGDSSQGLSLEKKRKKSKCKFP